MKAADGYPSCPARSPRQGRGGGPPAGPSDGNEPTRRSAAGAGRTPRGHSNGSAPRSKAGPTFPQESRAIVVA